MKLTFLFISSLFLTGCFFSQKPQVSSIQETKGEIFGSYYIVKYVGELDQTQFKEELSQFFKDFNQEFSTYQKSSVISNFNSAPSFEKHKVSPRFLEMLKLSYELHHATQGAFEPTLGPVIKLWGFGGGDKRRVPSDSEIQKALARVGMQHLQWDERAREVWKTRDGVELDLNAFAPGWAADLIGEMLEKHKITNYMVDISGEIRLRGEKSKGESWVIGIEKPSKQYAQGVQLAFRVKDLSVATSGDYRQFFDDKGERRSHIIHPKTGKPVEHTISSATVITNSATSADAWSTAMMVLGKEGMELAEKNGVLVYLLEAVKPGEFKSITSYGMETFLKASAL